MSLISKSFFKANRDTTDSDNLKKLISTLQEENEILKKDKEDLIKRKQNEINKVNSYYKKIIRNLTPQNIPLK